MAKSSSGVKAQVSSKGISSQDNGANELPGSYTTRPFPSYVGSKSSAEFSPLLGSKGGGDQLGPLNGRRNGSK